MKQLSRTLTYTLLIAVAVVSVLVYLCPFSLPSYLPVSGVMTDCGGDAGDVMQLGMSSAAAGCLGSHIGTGEDFTATMPKMASLLLALIFIAIFVRKRDLLLLREVCAGTLARIRKRYREHNHLLRLLFEKKLRAWLALQHHVVTAH